VQQVIRANDLRKHALTDAEIEVSALYRTLRQLERNDCVTSEWDVEGNGPARRIYKLTPRGKEHLEEWITVLTHMSQSMSRFVREARAQTAAADSKSRHSARQR
jgi:DNA-binding PadR family transcriptional regulator